MRILLTLLCLLLALPVLGVLGAWASFDAAAWSVLAHQAQTVLGGYAVQSLLLSAGVAVGVAAVGAGAAAAVALFEFPGRRVYEWALLLPLAMPAYVLAYVYTDFLQFSGPLQSALRALTGAEGARVLRHWPDVRSLPGAVILFVLALYPYVYLLVRTSLAERGIHLMEAARLLGAGFWRRVREVALPLSRPALVAGVALALMETLADYGVGAYFGLTTLSTGIFKAWLIMNDRVAAAQIASVLLIMVAALLWAERRARSTLRFAATRISAADGREARPVVLRGRMAWLAWVLCALPVLLGFVLPLVLLARLVWREALYGDVGLPWARFAQWCANSFGLAAAAALAAAALALALVFVARVTSPRDPRSRALQAGTSLVSLGYAVPGTVIAIGILLPLGALQAAWPDVALASLVTGTVAGLLLAYLVRFSAVALQTVDVGYTRLPPSLDDSARMLGASRSRLLAQVHAPLLKRSLLAAMLLVFVDVMKELPATLVLRPFNSDTLAVVAYNLARDERLAEAALPSIAIVVVGLLPVLLLVRAIRR